MNITNLIAEVQTELKQYNESGLLDEISLNNWARSGLREFGNLVTVLNEKTLEVRNGKARLPQSFYSLYVAAKCEPYEYEITCGDEEDIIDSLFYTVRTEAVGEWDNQSHAMVNDKEYKTVKEVTYFRNGKTQANLYYHKPQILTVKRGLNREKYAPNCINLAKYTDRKSQYEISIVGDYIQTNFEKGFIYIQYFSLPTDDSGEIEIPQLSNDKLYEYLSYTLKRRALEMLWMGEDENVANKIQYLLGMERETKMQAMSTAKAESVSGYGWWAGIKRRNTLRNSIYSNFTAR
jgi:hypothetical protein